VADAEARAIVVHSELVGVAVVAPREGDPVRHVLEVDEATPLASAAGVDTEPLESPAAVDDEHLALVPYTAGTTGEPKGVMLRHRHLAANHRQLAGTAAVLSAADRVLCALPLSHIYGLNVALAYPLAQGAAVTLVERFDAGATLRLAADDGVTVLPGVPPMLAAWTEVAGGEGAGGLDLSRLRFAISGAAPLAPSVLQRSAERLGVPVYEGHGLTESAPVLTSTAATGAMRPGSVGHPLPEVTLRLVGDDGQPVRRGDPGEVHARGPNIFAGYWRDPTETARALPDGWLATGDVGYERDGALHLIDRKRDLIIVSGFNVYPREVENVLAEHSAVAGSAVVGVPDPATGEAVKAFVQPLAGATPSADELIAHCADQLARFKVPVEVALVEELPVGLAGKLMRRRLREE
jgi:long-chain acyl-CoA synthetase